MARHSSSEATLSVVSGSQDMPLWNKTLGFLIEEQSQQYGDQIAVSFPWQQVRMTYRQLAYRSQLVANSLIRAGLQTGDRVGIMAGNCYQYIEMFLGSGRIGCPIVVLNNTYSPLELLRAVSLSQCKLLCIAKSIGKKSLADHLEFIRHNATMLEKIIIFSDDQTESRNTADMLPYDVFMRQGLTAAKEKSLLRQREASVLASSLLNLQFTSGTTGAPKAASLTHINLINNGRFVGDKMMLTHTDVVCCPPPLFHCFGLVMGFLSAFTHGSMVVFPSDHFDPDLVLEAISTENCTVLLGVPTMFLAELEANKRKQYKIATVRMGLAAGSPVPMTLMQQLEIQMGIKDILIAYGMTETSPVTFMTSLDDSPQRRLESVGKVMPHTRAKIIDKYGKTVPRGISGEICTSGYALQQGYWQNEAKTHEVMRYDEDGVLWMHTGDEGVIDDQGYCSITGRIKDIIIRGGENIFPTEIEERLLEHPCVIEACVVGMPDDVYGEVVSCFLRQAVGCERPNSAEIVAWVRQTMGKHKAPKYVWWVGDQADISEFSKTGSGKYQKHILKEIGQSLMRNERTLAKL